MSDIGALGFVIALLVGLPTSNPAPTPAARVAETVQVGPAPSWGNPPGPCGEWFWTAIDVGWPDDQWPTISRVMWCESKCTPSARNRSGASGLMQVMPMWWHGRDPFDPATNLTMALEVWHAQGWHAWSCY